VRRILLALASEVKYDPDRLRNQDPAAVFSTRRAYCVGFAELAVDLLRRVGISARTVQGVLRTDPTADRYDPAIGGVYHRWIEVYYPDRGYVFSDPAASVNGVDARYVAFEGRSLTKPRSLRLTELMPPEGALEYATVRAGGALIRVRASR
jgi:transglutaminase-like putative cysteine protease